MHIWEIILYLYLHLYFIYSVIKYYYSSTMFEAPYQVLKNTMINKTYSLKLMVLAPQEKNVKMVLCWLHMKTVIRKKKREILKCKSNKTCTGLVCWKLQNTHERHWINGEIYHAHELEDNVGVYQLFAHWYIGLNTIPIKITAWYFVYIDRLTLKCKWKGKGTRIG